MSTAVVPAPGQAAPIAHAGETSSSAIAAREKAAVEARFLVALHRPRNPDLARTRLLARCAAPLFAEVAEYSKPVGGGKKARGASIRMMEEIARNWQNIDIQATVVFDDRERRTITVTATDLESNYSGSVDVMLEKTVERRAPRSGDEVLGSRVNSNGETVYRIAADEDAFLVKQNANIAKARRECIRAIVPGDLVDEAMAKCAETRRSEVRIDPAAARKRLADAFYAIGVMPDQLCEFLGKPSLEAVTEAEIEYLRAIYAGMKDGEATWADVMEEKRGATKPAENGAAAPAPKGASGLKAALDKKNGKPVDATPALETEAERTARLAEDAKLAKET